MVMYKIGGEGGGGGVQKSFFRKLPDIPNVKNNSVLKNCINL